MNRWIPFRQPHCSIRGCHGLRSSATVRKALAPKEGQSLAELAVVVPLILLLILTIIAFGILFEDKIAMNNAARDGVRWASQNPDAWDNTATASSSSIEGQIQGEGGTVTIPNDDAHIGISYFTVSFDANGSPTSTSPTFCGSYNAATDSFVYSAGSSLPSDPAHPGSGTFANSGGCLNPGNLIQVTVTQNFPLPIPIISRIFPGGVTLSASATMAEETYP